MIEYSKILAVNYANSLWAISEDDYETLEWFSETKKPSKDELDVLWESTQAALIAKQQAAVAIKASAQAKLKSIGLTDDEIKALIG
jgi:hypothetical protein